jgi:hypothetical protein
MVQNNEFKTPMGVIIKGHKAIMDAMIHRKQKGLWLMNGVTGSMWSREQSRVPVSAEILCGMP